MSAVQFRPLGGNSSPRPHPPPGGIDRCDQDAYSLFGDSVHDTIGVTPVQPQTTQDNRPQGITIMTRPNHIQFPVTTQSRGASVMIDDSRRRARLLSDESETPFVGGFCRQLAAMYTDVGMTTVERVRWLCGWMILVYALTCFAWFAWPAYPVPVGGITTGTVGLLACQRPHERSYMTYVLTFLALNYAQLLLLGWLLFVGLTTELTTCTGNCAGVEAKAVFIVLMVLATGTFHWRVATVTRQYAQEFRMIEQLVISDSQAYFFDASYSRAAASSIVATDIMSRSSGSADSVSVIRDEEPQVSTHPALTHSDQHQVRATRL